MVTVRTTERRERRHRIVRMLVGALALVVFSGALLAQQPPPRPPEGFVPVDEARPQEHLPAAPLVMAAYAVAWVGILLYLWSIWRRLARVEREIADVTRRVEGGARR